MILKPALIFIMHIIGAVLSIFPLKTLIWNEMMLRALNSLNVLEPVENELEKLFSEGI